MDAQTIIAKRIARELHSGMLVNLGIGIPTLVANYLPEGLHVFFQSENGLIGTGPIPEEGMAHPTLTDLTIFGGGQSPTDAALASLTKLPKLRRLTLNCDEQYIPRSYSGAGIDAFRKARPDVHLHVDGQDFPPSVAE